MRQSNNDANQFVKINNEIISSNYRIVLFLPSFLHGLRLHGNISIDGSQDGFDESRVRFFSPTPHVPIHSPSCGLLYVPSQLTLVGVCCS